MKFGFCFFVALASLPAIAADGPPAIEITVDVDRGQDIGQCFGTLFEATSDDQLITIGAGFANSYNTRYRGDRHAIQFFVRPRAGARPFQVKALPRPNELCGTYLYSRDDKIYSTYGGVKRWIGEEWRESPSLGGTNESMRVGHGVLEFGASEVRYNQQVILPPPKLGSYQLFFYANGHLCFYHVHKKDRPYRPYQSDDDGFSKLYACPWKPGEPSVNLNKAITKTLPVVGETTFAWGQRGDEIVTGSNIGGFYSLENQAWSMLLEPQLGVSYQLYSTLSFGDRLLMGQYPTGRLFAYDGKTLADQAGWPPTPQGVSKSAREAQTTVIYGGEVFVGVWPWGELWRYNPSSKSWSFVQRMFEHPQQTDQTIHPYDVENRGNPVGNLWGQRITSLTPHVSSLYVATSAKYPCEWDAKKYPFLADQWKSYGSVYRLTMPGHVSAATQWTDGPTTFKFTIRNDKISIQQDGRLLASASLAQSPTSSSVSSQPTQVSEPLHQQVHQKTFGAITWKRGIYGTFSGKSVAGQLVQQKAKP